MRKSKFQISLKTKTSEIFFLRIIVGSLLITTFFLCVLVSRREVERIITPPVVTKEFRIQKDFGDPQYYQQMGLYFAQTIGNISHETTDFTLKLFNEYMTADLKESIRNSLIDQILKIKENNMDTIFVAKGVNIEKNAVVTVAGKRTTYINKEPIDEAHVSYKFEFEVRNWHIYITDFDITLKRYGDDPELRRERKQDEHIFK